jgi:hypothetical protein
MKTALTFCALLLAAVAAFFFPAMKTPILVLALALFALLVTGCTSGFAAKLNKMPDGRWSTARLEETDKFTSTTIQLDGVSKDNGQLSAKQIVIDHTNPWMTKFHFEATDYEAQLSAAAKKKLFTPLLPPGSGAAPAPVPPTPAPILPTASASLSLTGSGSGFETAPTVRAFGGGGTGSQAAASIAPK